MTAIYEQFRFLEPWWLLLLAGLPLAIWWLLRSRHTHGELVRLADSELLPLLVAPGRSHRRLPLLLLSMCWILASVALAAPAWERLPTPLTAGGQVRVIALSLSARMLATDLAPNRLARARFKIRDLLGAERGDRNALIAYAGEAFVVAPLTPDVDTVLNLVDNLEPSVMPVAGDNTASAIALGVQLIEQAGASGGEILLVTSSAGEDALEAARAARTAGVTVSVLAFGSASGAPVATEEGFLKDARGDLVMAALEEQELRQLAAAGGGRYQPARTDGRDIAALLADTPSGSTASTARSGSDDRAMADRWRDRGPWLLLALVPLAAFGFRRGWLTVLALFLSISLVPASPAHAAENDWWEELWYNADQQAARALDAGEAERAQELAQSPLWRGAAAYRAEDYPQAADAFAQRADADAHYNRGNALARAERFEDAIAAYDKALALDPAHADARANRKAVVEWLRKQQQQQSGTQQQDKQQGDSGEQSDKQSRPGQGNGSQSGKQSQSQPGTSEPDSGRSRQQGRQADAQGNKQNARENSASPQAGQSGKLDAQKAATDAAEAKRAEQALRQDMDRAMTAKQRTDDPQQGDKKTTEGFALGEQPGDDALKQLPATARHALRRVPDDPGGLLRRKFLLEYQRRQMQGETE